MSLIKLPTSIQADIDTLASLSTPDLRRELSRSLELTASHLRRLAAIVRLLEERGEDLSDLRVGLLGYLRQIAYGQVVAELVVRFAETPGLLRSLAALPWPDQESLARGEPVTMVVRRDDGSFDRRLADPAKLPREQFHQVFAKGRIRDEAEQILILESGKVSDKITAIGKPPRVGKITVDRKRGSLRIGQNYYPMNDVQAALVELRLPPSDPAADDILDKTIPVKLTEAEHRAMRQVSIDTGLSMTILIRRALKAAGLI